MLIIPTLFASSGCSSTLIFPTLISVRSLAISSTIGTTLRQGAHQGAQKSTQQKTVCLDENQFNQNKLFFIFTLIIFALHFVFSTAHKIFIWDFSLELFCLSTYIFWIQNRYKESHFLALHQLSHRM